MMQEIPVKIKEVKYSKTIGITSGRIFTKAIMKIDETKIRFEHNRFLILRYLFNQLPIEFKKNEPVELYKNEKLGSHIEIKA